MPNARLRERLQYRPNPDTQDARWSRIEYQMNDLAGIPEAGNGSHDLTVYLDGHRVRLWLPDGWGTLVEVDGRDATDEEAEEILPGCVSDVETAVIHDYLQQCGHDDDTIGRYWSLEGVEADAGTLS